MQYKVKSSLSLSYLEVKFIVDCYAVNAIQGLPTQLAIVMSLTCLLSADERQSE